MQNKPLQVDTFLALIMDTESIIEHNSLIGLLKILQLFLNEEP
jgi:hypothetical protein